MPQTTFEYLLEDFLVMGTPQGYRAELIDDEIIVRPPPDGNHESVLSKLSQQFYRRASMELEISFKIGLVIPAGRFIPDLAVWVDGMLADKPPWVPADGLLLVTEVTSGDPYRDRVAKRMGYAAAGIPLYVLVDRERGAVVLHSDPDTDSGDYLMVHNASYGKDVPLPAPFDFALETNDF
jgi:Uma2 family endonuclease